MADEESKAVAKRIVEACEPWTRQLLENTAATVAHIQRVTISEIADIARGKAGDGFDLNDFADLLVGEEDEAVDGRG